MKLLLAAFLSIVLVSCASKPEVKKDTNRNEIPEPFVEVSGVATPTDTARFLAGRPVHSGAILSRMQLGPDYQMFSRDMAQKWKFRTSRRIASQNHWQATHVAPLIGAPRTVLYPFGGPDLLYAMALFPDSDRYILLGLEPAGSLPDLEHVDPALVASSLPRHAKALETQLLHGYFITKDMKTDFSNGALQGVTPVLLSALGLMDAEIHQIQSINAGGNAGVEIDFTLPGRGRKSMVYVSGDLSNKGFQGSYAAWISSVASGSTAYFKAASYLMQDQGFSTMKHWILSNCRSVVQDDSGIPYAAFDLNQWEIHLFGNYTAPIDFFAKYTQADLRTAYASGGPYMDLPFGSGYQMNAGKGNLLVAVRK